MDHIIVLAAPLTTQFELEHTFIPILLGFTSETIEEEEEKTERNYKTILVL